MTIQENLLYNNLQWPSQSQQASYDDKFYHYFNMLLNQLNIKEFFLILTRDE